MQGICLKISNQSEKLRVGSSKLFGNPDVWSGFEWPFVEENGKKYDLTFMCQINCAQAADFDESGALPKTGMLYFFYDLDTMPELSDEKSARVIWQTGEMSGLHKMILTDENGNDMAFSEQKIDFKSNCEDEKSSHLLLGDVDLKTAEKYDFIKGKIPLLRLWSFETEDAQVRFKNNGALCFYIEPNRLLSHDSSNVKAAQIKA